jgi:hypothetical protein
MAALKADKVGACLVNCAYQTHTRRKKCPVYMACLACPTCLAFWGQTLWRWSRRVRAAHRHTHALTVFYLLSNFARHTRHVRQSQRLQGFLVSSVRAAHKTRWARAPSRRRSWPAGWDRPRWSKIKMPLGPNRWPRHERVSPARSPTLGCVFCKGHHHNSKTEGNENAKSS